MTMTVLSFIIYLSSHVILSAAYPQFMPRQRNGLTLEILHDGPIEPVLNQNFPDPTIIQDRDGTWYAFATESGGRSVQVARADGADPFGNWTLLEDVDALPEDSWTSGRNTWAPDVRLLPDGSYIMYFTGELPDSHQHCIGVARSRTIQGPYRPDPAPWVCPREQGGAIDASGFVDPATLRRYVAYKVDGNSAGDFSPCGTGADDPSLRTPLMLQEVSFLDGATKIGAPVELMDRVAAEDGALVEAPNLTWRRDGTYVLFFSSHCFNDPAYDVKYAWSQSVTGPYRRAPEALLRRPDFGLSGPGGMTAAMLGTEGGDGDGDEFMAFHGNCERGRCMYMARYGEEE